MAADENLDDVISDLIDGPAEAGPAEKAAPPKPNGSGSGEQVRLTERAARQVRRIKADEGLSDDLYLRIAVEGGGCSGLSYKLGFDHRGEEDEILESQELEVLVDPRHMIYLEGIVIDYPDGLNARGFTFENPNASETCGCGSSFAT